MKKSYTILLMALMTGCIPTSQNANLQTFGTCENNTPRKSIERLNSSDEGSSIEVITYHTAKWENESTENGHYLRGISNSYTKSQIFYDAKGEKVSGDVKIYNCDFSQILEEFTLKNGEIEGVVFDNPQTKDNKFRFYENGNLLARVSQADKKVLVITYYYNGEALYEKELLNDKEQNVRDLFFSPLENGETATLTCSYYYRPDVNQDKANDIVMTSEKQSDLTPLSCPNMITFKDYNKIINQSTNEKEE